MCLTPDAPNFAPARGVRLHRALPLVVGFMISSSLVAAQTPNPQSRPESSEKIITFDIPSQPLGLALETFSTVAEIELFYESDLASFGLLFCRLNIRASSAVFSTPTINGYKRYRSYSLPPDRAIWGRDNRGVMIRVFGGPNDPATRLENRIGEPAADPYLDMASQILSGLDGIDRSLDPGAFADTPYETKASLLPTSLREAVFALKDDPFFRAAMGEKFVDYYVFIKNAEIERFQSGITEWEQREYFEMF